MLSMPPMDQPKTSKIRVLLAAHIGEPKGGVSTYYEDLLASELKDCVELHFIETSKGSQQTADRGKWKLSTAFNALTNILRFLSALISVKPDLVQIGTAYGASFAKHSLMVCLARLFLVPVILQPHCSVYKLIPQDQTFYRKYVLFILRQCSAITVLSREWESLTGLIPNIMIRYIPNAIDIEPYVTLPRPRHDANGKVNILYLGHVVREKGVWDLVRAAALIDKKIGFDFQVNIVGESLYEKDLESIRELITSSNLQEWVAVFNPEYGEKKIKRFASTDIFVLPSYHEGMPMSIIEAMAAGLPVVASAVGGIPDLIQDQENGLLINPGDAQDLSTKLSDLIANPEKRLALGTSGRQKATLHYSIKVNVNRLVSVYQETVKVTRR